MNRAQNVTLRLLAFALLAICSMACSNLKYLDEDEVLYIGANVKVQSDTTIKNKAALQTEMEGLIRPQPNTVFLGMRIKLWFYNKAGETDKEKGFKYWMRNKLGEPPVLLQDAKPDYNEKLLDNRLHNSGYFWAETDHEVKFRRGGKIAKIDYTSSVSEPYTIDTISYPDSTDAISFEINTVRGESLLHTGDNYDLEVLKAERERINEVVKNRGYYYFSPDHIIYEVDSTEGRRSVNVFMELDDNMPIAATRKYNFNKVFVHSNYDLTPDSIAVEMDTLMVNGYYYITERNPELRPDIVVNEIFIREGQRYNREDYYLTVDRLMGLGVFKFVNIRLTDVDSTGEYGLLNAHIFLTPLQKKSIRLETGAAQKSNNYADPFFDIRWTNRNFLGGAETFQVSFVTGLEWQIGGRSTNTSGFSYEVGGDIDLYVPRFITPFNIKRQRNQFVPKTRFQLGYRLLNRANFFTLNSYSFNYGYSWRETQAKSHDLNALSLTYVSVGKRTDRFEEILNNNPVLRRSFEQQFILGANYTYTYDENLTDDDKSRLFFRGKADIAGNTLNAIQGFAGTESKDDSARTLFGIAYSQYAKVEADLRYYFHFSDKHSIASRIITGVGYPYGNSEVLPYVKQFFIGGPNSIRAFRARSVGPGTNPPSSQNTGLFIDQTGDIKIEGNLEYRFTISGPLKGAVFLDAGNVWLVNENPAQPGGKFEASSFFTEMAIGTGFGIRVDVQFFVIRFDIGIPLREPWEEPENPLPEEQINENAISNTVFNIAIGYPF